MEDPSAALPGFLEQLAQVNALLVADPNNVEVLAVKAQLCVRMRAHASLIQNDLVEIAVNPLRTLALQGRSHFSDTIIA